MGSRRAADTSTGICCVLASGGRPEECEAAREIWRTWRSAFNHDYCAKHCANSICKDSVFSISPNDSAGALALESKSQYPMPSIVHIITDLDIGGAEMMLHKVITNLSQSFRVESRVSYWRWSGWRAHPQTGGTGTYAEHDSRADNSGSRRYARAMAAGLEARCGADVDVPF